MAAGEAAERNASASGAGAGVGAGGAGATASAPWDYRQPVELHFGCGRRFELGQSVAQRGWQRGLLVTSAGFAKRGTAAELAACCEGRIVATYAEVSPNPTVQECDACVALIRRHRCDFVVALGGGSAMDCAKAAANISQGPHSAAACLADLSLLPATSLPVVALPTTAGTASEVTRVAVLSDHATGVKSPIRNDVLYPKLAIVDPELTFTVLQHTTASSGIDALCHAIEGYWSRGHLPVTDALAPAAISRILTNLEIVCAEPENQEARTRMAEASMLAGLVFSAPGTTAPHACSYPLTNLLGIVHGEACALTLPYFLQLNAAHDAEGRIDALARAVGFADAAAFGARIVELKAQVGLASDLRAYNVDDAMLERLVEGSQNSTLANNPVPVDAALLRDVFEQLR